MTLAPGIHRSVPMADYLALDAIGSTHLSWLAVSPLYYRWAMRNPDQGTVAMALGTAVHTAILEPETFKTQYVSEPDPREVAPDNAKPRATKAYREACAALEASGRMVIRNDAAEKVWGMAQAVNAHPLAAKLLARAPERELTLLWDCDGRACRGRADMLGDGVLGDLKTTRNLARFSPFELTRFGYHRQLAHYLDGLKRLGREVKHVLIVAVESEPPFDVGVFELDPDALAVGEMQREELMTRLAECEASGTWPGMFEGVQKGTLTDAVIAEAALADLEVA